jgi:hypothetical protein
VASRPSRVLGEAALSITVYRSGAGRRRALMSHRRGHNGS